MENVAIQKVKCGDGDHSSFLEWGKKCYYDDDQN